MTQSSKSEATPEEASAPPDYEGVDAEVEAWAERERKRRQAWLDGPSEAERARMRKRLVRRAAQHEDDEALEPETLDEQVERWARREHERRAAWLAGPDPESYFGSSFGSRLAGMETDYLERRDALARMFFDTDLAAVS